MSNNKIGNIRYLIIELESGLLDGWCKDFDLANSIAKNRGETFCTTCEVIEVVCEAFSIPDSLGMG